MTACSISIAAGVAFGALAGIMIGGAVATFIGWFVVTRKAEALERHHLEERRVRP